MGLLDNQTQQEYYNGNDHGGYQFTSLSDIISQFMAVYVGEDKNIRTASRIEVAFHAQRAMQELSFDTFKSCKSQEITLPPSLQMALPQDYVNYQKISWIDGAGIKHLMYPASKTSNPTSIYQNTDGEYKLEISATLTANDNNIVLDGLHPNVARKMRVEGPSIPDDTYILIHDDDVGGTNSIIVLGGFTPTYSSVETLTFSEVDGDLIANLDDGVSIMGGTPTTGFDTTTGSNKLTLEPNSTQIVSDVKVGMLAFSFDTSVIPEGTTVIQVDSVNNVVFLSDPVNLGSLNVGVMFVGKNSDSTTWSNYKANTPTENNSNDYDVDDDIYDLNVGQRYGIDPQHAQVNGSFYIDCTGGKIHFSSNVGGKTVVLDYLSDGLGTDGEMQVHKFAEEAMYKWITHAVLASKANTPEYIVARFKKERYAAIRNAKLRLSNIKLEEITQILRGKSKQIKH